MARAGTAAASCRMMERRRDAAGREARGSADGIAFRVVDVALVCAGAYLIRIHSAERAACLPAWPAAPGGISLRMVAGAWPGKPRQVAYAARLAAVLCRLAGLVSCAGPASGALPAPGTSPAISRRWPTLAWQAAGSP